MREVRRVGVIGLGKMGGPIARHLVGKGFSVAGYDVLPAAVAACAALGVVPAASPAEVAERSELVIILVGFESQVEQVLLGKAGVLGAVRSGAVIAIGSTIAPNAMAKYEARLGRSDIALLDIPLCRGEAAAEEGKLLIMGGGERTAFERWRPAFETFSDAIFHLGPVGSGQVGKMINNFILWSCMSANYEGLKLADGLGVPERLLRPALIVSSANNWSLETGAENKPVPWAEKDMTIVLAEADRARVSLPPCGTVKEVIKGIKIERNLPTPVAPER